jgi:hypothetical protein
MRSNIMNNLVGKEVVIEHCSDGAGNMTVCKAITRRVAAEYMGGRILDHCGEQWLVKLGNDDKLYTQYERVSRRKGRKM